MTRLAATLLALALSVTALAAPSVPEPTAEEAEQVRTGAVVTRSEGEVDGMNGVLAWVEIRAKSGDIWSVLNDADLIEQSSSTVASCEKYRHEMQGPKQLIALAYVLEVAFSEVRYHVLREFHPDENYLTWTLDPDKPSDIVRTEGLYALTPGSTADALRLSYVSRADSGRKVPTWIQQMLTGRTVRSYLEFVKQQAEAR